MIYRVYIKAILVLCITIMSCSALGDSIVKLDDVLIIPEGKWEGKKISKKKIKQKIIESFNSITHISHIRFKDVTHWYEIATYGIADVFQVTFIIQTHSKTLPGKLRIQCYVMDSGDEIPLRHIAFVDCGNDEVTFNRNLIISMYDIAINPDSFLID